MVFLYCFLRLNLKTRILAARSAPTMVPVTLPPETSSPPSWKDALTASCTSEPMSPASFSTRITSPGATRYCFPPVSMIACMQTSLLGAGTHGVRRNHWSKEPVYNIGADDSNPLMWPPTCYYRVGHSPHAIIPYGLSSLARVVWTRLL